MLNKTKKLIIIVITVLVVLETVILGSLAIYQITQNSYEHYMETAQKYVSEKDYEQAIAEFNRAIKKDPQAEDAYLELADVYIKMEDYDKAIDILQQGYDTTEARSLSRKLEKIQKQLEEAEVETSAVVETVQEEAVTVAFTETETETFAETETATYAEEFTLDDDQKSVLELMSRYMPEFQSIYRVDDYFWWEFIFYSFTEGAFEDEMSDDGMYYRVSEGTINTYVNQLLGVDFPGIDCDADYNQQDYGDGDIHYTIYYEDGYYYVNASDGGMEWYQFDDMESVGFDHYKVTCGMYGPNDDYSRDEWYGVNHIFMIESRDNRIGFVITSHQIVSEDN